MKSNLKDIIESIPDFEDFLKLGEQIGQLSFEKLRMENQIKSKESETFKKAMAIPNGEGKFPSASFVTNSYLHTGLDGELVGLRDGLAFLTSELDKKRIQLAIYRDMLEVFRTISANERSSGF